MQTLPSEQGPRRPRVGHIQFLNYLGRDVRRVVRGYTAVMDGIARLRAMRGEERVTFDDVADHLVDFADRHPDSRETVDRLALFLAKVERVPHDHDADPERGLAGTPESQVPAV